MPTCLLALLYLLALLCLLALNTARHAHRALIPLHARRQQRNSPKPYTLNTARHAHRTLIPLHPRREQREPLHLLHHGGRQPLDTASAK